MIEHEKYFLENNKQIDVLDGVFPLSFRIAAYDFCRNSLFKIGWSDSIVPERKANDFFLHSTYSSDDLNNLGILPFLENSAVKELTEGLTLEKSILNLSVSSDVNYVHTHPEKKVVLYYANLDWREGWHGETQFYSENLKNIQFSTPYTPGRVIVFDADIPHTIRPQSSIATQHRFTLALCYN